MASFASSVPRVAHASMSGPKMQISSSYAKMLGETNFQSREFTWSGSKAKDGEKEREKDWTMVITMASYALQTPPEKLMNRTWFHFLSWLFNFSVIWPWRIVWVQPKFQHFYHTTTYLSWTCLVPRNVVELCHTPYPLLTIIFMDPNWKIMVPI